MPMEGLHIILGSGVGVGVIAGVFYLIFSNTKGDRQKRKEATHCHVCYQPLLPAFPSQNVVCFICEHRVCRPPEFENIFAGTNFLYHKGSRCSRFDNTVKKWKCFKCIRNNSTIEDTYRAIVGARGYTTRRNSTGSILGRMSLDSRATLLDLQTESMISEQLERERQRIRVLIEGQAGRMVGGNLDEVKIGRLYAHPLYEQMFSKHHGILSRALAKLASTLHQVGINLPSTSNASKSSSDGNNLSSAEIGLRDAVRRVAREASRLPLLSDAGDPEMSAGRISPRPPDGTYEELLATAILNKVIDTFQKDRYGSSMPGSVSSHPSSRSNSFRVNPLEDLSDVNFDEIERPRNGRIKRHLNSLEPENQGYEPVDALPISDKPRRNSGFRRRHKVREIDDGSISSMDDYSGESCSPHHPEDISFTMKPRIGEFASSDIEAYDNQVESSDYSEINGAKPKTPTKKPASLNGQYIDEEFSDHVAEPWEENWLFQKKKTKNPILSTPVAMLVPKASIEYRALIGDRDADDTTDLSDAGSDYEDLLTESNTNDIKSVLVTSRTIIGGKNDFDIVKEIVEENDPVVPPEESVAEAEIVPEVDQPKSESYEVFDAEKDVKSIKNKIAIWDNFYHKRGEELRRTEDLSNTEFTSLKPGMKEDLLEAKNSHLLDSQCSESSSIESHQQDGEYSIHYDSLESKPIHPIPSPRKNTSKYNYDSGIDLSEGPPMKGTIAEREHKKWENAVPMPNNPYTPENIEKRLNQRSASIISLPQVTALERRNSYKREIKSDTFDNENISNVNGLSVPETNQENTLSPLRSFDKSQSCTNLSEGKHSSLSRNGSSCSIGKKSRLERDYYINDPEYISRNGQKEHDNRPTSVESFYDDEKDKNRVRKSEVDVNENDIVENVKDLGETLSLNSSVSSYDTINSPTDVQLVYNFNSQVITICKPNEELSDTENKSKNSNDMEINATPAVKSRSLINISQYEKKPSQYSIDNNTHSCVNLTESQINFLPPFTNEFSTQKISLDEVNLNKIDKEVEANLNDSIDNLQSSDYEDTVETTPELTDENLIFDDLKRPSGPIPSVKERLKCFLNPKFIDFDQDKIKPNHSITARSIFRRSNNANANNLLLADGNNPEGTTKNLLDDMSSKTLKERRDFFESLNK